MRSRAALAGLLAGILLTPSCLSPPPRLSLHTAHGLVRAESSEQAHTVGEQLDDFVPRVRELLPDTRAEPVEIWVQKQLEVYAGWPFEREVPAFTVEGVGRIHMLEAEPQQLSAALAHELVHALLGPSWSTLPPVAEEGLADWVQEQLHPEWAASLRSDHLAKASAAFGGMPFGLWSAWPVLQGRRLATFRFPGTHGPDVLQVREALEHAPRGRWRLWQPYEVSVSDPRLYGIGYLVVARIVESSGVQGLHALCLQAQEQGLEHVPADWLLAAARLDGDPNAWLGAIVERIGVGELTTLGQALVPFLTELVSEGLRPNSRARSGSEFLARYRPLLGLVGGDVRVPLIVLPGLSDGVLQAWPLPADRTARVQVTGKALSWTALLSPGASAPEPVAP